MLFDPNQTQDPYGRLIYYQVGDQTTTSKILALELAGGDLNQISFHWNEHLLDKLDWSQEPAESFDAMLDRTVLNLRNQYQHINLFYSAGYDSQTIYEAFRRNRIVIDRFLIWRREWYQGHSDIEYQLALQSAQWIKQNIWPNLEIVTLAWRVQDNHAWYRNMKSDWIYHAGSVLKFSKHNRDLIYTYNDPVKKSVWNHNNSVTIIGHEKPKLDLYDNQWYVSHLDTQLYTELHDPALHFYHIPEIYCKQAWMIVRWLETLPNCSHELLHKIQSNSAGPEMYKQYNLAMGRCEVWHDYNAYGMGKAMWSNPDPRHVPESQNFLQQTQGTDPDVYNYYDQGLRHIEKNFGHLIGKNGNLPGLFSKKYLLKLLELNT